MAQRRRRPGWHASGQRADDRARSADERVAEAARLDELVLRMVRLTDGTRRDDARLATYADVMLNRAAPVDPDDLLATLERLTLSLLGRLTTGGWSADDLERLVERTVGRAHLASVRELLGGGGLSGLASGLGLAALFTVTPVLDARALVGHAAASAGEHPKLAQVRALLAKAESTDYPEEAELLTAKAQQLVTRYALDGLLGAEAGGSGAPRPGVRRLWLDAPYVDAKASLVARIAEANRCRSASAERLGFCVVVGDARDLDAVELLLTSLLLQADAAMLHHGGSPGGRRRSFRRAFLHAYAQRVGERLGEATRAAYRDAGGDALPVLAAHEERVGAAFAEAVPDVVLRAGPTLGNGHGWAAGRAAADLARLDVREGLDGGSSATVGPPA